MFTYDELYQIKWALENQLEYFEDLRKNILDIGNECMTISEKNHRISRWQKKVDDTRLLLEKVQNLLDDVLKIKKEC